MQPRWKDLQELARRSSSDDRAVLLRRLADLLMHGGFAGDSAALAVFEDVVLRILTQVDHYARIEFSERVGPTAVTPRNLVLVLANDIVAVAEPVLRFSPLLTEKDLLEIAETTGPAHLEVIARRIFLSTDLTDTLVARGQGMVHRTIAGNDGAQISSGAYRVLLKGAAEDAVLQELIALRPNLPVTVNERLVKILSVDVRRRLTARWTQLKSPANADSMSAPEPHATAQVEMAPIDNADFINLQNGIEDGVLTLDEAIRQACRLNRHDWLIDLISTAGGGERATVLTVLLMRESRPLTLTMRALGIGAESFRAVLDMRARHLRVGSNDPRLVVDYEALEPTVASAILKKHHGNALVVPNRP